MLFASTVYSSATKNLRPKVAEMCILGLEFHFSASFFLSILSDFMITIILTSFYGPGKKKKVITVYLAVCDTLLVNGWI